jgi:hypothetical protein
MTIMMLVHSMHHMEWTRRVNRRQLEEDIPLKVGGRNFTLWMSTVSKSSVLNTFLTPFEARIFLKESRILIDFSFPSWGEG